MISIPYHPYTLYRLRLESVLRQIHRVTITDGTLLFCEHGAAPGKSVLKWQNRINPIWKLIDGGCHLNRPISKYIQMGDFTIELLETLYLPYLPKIADFNYIGSAKKDSNEIS